MSNSNPDAATSNGVGRPFRSRPGHRWPGPRPASVSAAGEYWIQNSGLPLTSLARALAAALFCGELCPREKLIPSWVGQPCPHVTAGYEARRVLGSVLASKIQQDRGESPGRTAGLARRRASWMTSWGSSTGVKSPWRWGDHASVTGPLFSAAARASRARVL